MPRCGHPWHRVPAPRYMPVMSDDAFAHTLSTVAAGRAAVVARLRALAARLYMLLLDAAADVLVLVEPALRSFEQHAALALDRAPAGPS